MLQSRIFVEQFFFINMCWTRPLHWDSSIFIFPEHEDRLGENTQMWENSQIAQQTYCLSNVIFGFWAIFSKENCNLTKIDNLNYYVFLILKNTRPKNLLIPSTVCANFQIINWKLPVPTNIFCWNSIPVKTLNC